MSIRGYQLKELVGSGGFGQVYRAEQSSVDREVAIKVILPEFSDHPDFVARFQAEARTVAKLEHPHIVPLYDFWQDDDGAFLVMRYVRDGSLRDRLEADGALSPQDLGPILEQICDALAAAHAEGVIHRDLKPENILIDERGQAYLTDFGIAKDLSGNSLTKTGGFMGSAAYLAPEQARAEPVTPSTDIYALGVLLYELFTGEHPFPDLTTIQLIQHHMDEPLPHVNPAAVDDAIQHATAKMPEARPVDVQAFAAELRAALASPTDEPEITLPPFATSDELAARPVFVGREADLAWLDQQLKQALDSGGRVAFVAGGPGRGKTSLVNEFAYRSAQQHSDLITVFGSANAFSGLGDPYLPFRDVLAMLTGEVEAKWAGGLISTEQARSLWGLTPTTLSTLLDHGPELLDVFVETHELGGRAAAAGASDTRINALRAQAGRDRHGVQQTQLFEQYTAVLRTLAADHPILLVLDDLQWADGASISMLFHLGRRLESAPILILGTFREEEVALGRDGERHPLEKVVAELRQSYGDIRLGLDDSPETAERDFLDELLDSEPNALDVDFRAALFQRTGGHPLFSVELLRSMQERGDLIQDDDGRWVAGPSLNWDRLPERVEAVIQERVGRLEDELRELLSVASVEGEQFTAEVVAQVQEIQERRLLRQLSGELEKRHRLVREQGEVHAGSRILSRYRFSHQLFQRYLYNELSAGERRLLHQEVARTLEDLHAEDLDEISVQLARHYREAGDVARAVQQYMAAGGRARRLYANQEALGHFNRALELASDPNDEMMGERGAVLLELFHGEAAVEDYEWLLESARKQGDRQSELEALLGLGRGHYIISLDHPETGAAEASLKYYDEAYEMAVKLSDEAGVIRSRVPTIWFTDFWPEYEHQARVNAEQAHEASRAIDDQQLRLEADLAMFYTDPSAERPARGRVLLEELEAQGNLSRLNYLLFGMMFVTLGTGDLEETVELCDRGIAVAARIGVPPVQYPTIKGIALARLGRIDQSLASLDNEVADEAHRLGRAFREVGRAIVHLELQDYASTVRILENDRPLIEELARAWMQDTMHLLLTRAASKGRLLDKMSLDSTLEYLNIREPSTTDMSLRGMRSPTASLALAEYALATGEPERALDLADEAKDRARGHGRRPETVMALELIARIRISEGDWEAALQAARTGVELANEIGYRPMLWQLLGLEGKALDGLHRTEDADQARAQAAEVVKAIADTVSDAGLRATFLASPEASDVLEQSKS
jgi:tetratricopeptide (TPR) repeat protein